MEYYPIFTLPFNRDAQESKMGSDIFTRVLCCVPNDKTRRCCVDKGNELAFAASTSSCQHIAHLIAMGLRAVNRSGQIGQI